MKLHQIQKDLIWAQYYSDEPEREWIDQYMFIDFCKEPESYKLFVKIGERYYCIYENPVLNIVMGYIESNIIDDKDAEKTQEEIEAELEEEEKEQEEEEEEEEEEFKISFGFRDKYNIDISGATIGGLDAEGVKDYIMISEQRNKKVSLTMECFTELLKDWKKND